MLKYNIMIYYISINVHGFTKEKRFSCIMNVTTAYFFYTYSKTYENLDCVLLRLKAVGYLLYIKKKNIIFLGDGIQIALFT